MKTFGTPGALALAFAAALTVAGCGNSPDASMTSVTGTKDVNSAMSSTVTAVSDTATLVSRTSAAAGTSQKVDVQWLDADTFDRTLSKTMAQQPSEIHVNLDTGASQVPARISTWFGEVTDRGGHVSTMTETAWAQLNGVQTADAVQTRGIFLLILPFAFQWISQQIHEEATYGPASNYDALLIVNNARDHIDMLVFKHKEPAKAQSAK